MSFGNKQSYFLLRDLQVVGISPEMVPSPEQGRFSGRTASFSLWTGMFRDGMYSISDETYCCDLVVFASFWELVMTFG